MKKTILATLLLALAAVVLHAEEEGAKESIWKKGYVSAGLESNTIFYMDDATTGAERPQSGIGTNNYLKVDFGWGLIEGGLQMEGYFPPIQGYPTQLHGFSLSNRYVRIKDKGLSATVGDFYEQLGSGLLFRAYEERSLGINTALEGVHASYNWDGKLTAKAFLGCPRTYKDYNYNSRVTAADLSLNVMALAGREDLFGLHLEGSFLNKHQNLESEWMQGLINPDVNGYSARMAFDWNGLTLKGEYVSRNSDAGVFNNYSSERSRAILMEGTYTYGGLGVNATFRKLNNAGFQSSYNESGMFTFLNYVPSLTQQHTYSLAALNPYQSQVNGEIGGQLDVYYFFGRNTKAGGAKGMKLHGNFSTYYGPSPAPQIKANELYFRDLTVDAERWWGKNVKTIVLYTWQTYNNRVGTHPSYEFRQSHTIVADVTYKFNNKHALRAEYQHLWSRQDQGNWCAGMLEYTFAPGLSVNFSDMWNYGYTRTHYFNGGVSYSWSRTRASLSFGRFREGYQCAGGVCRLIPAYTGANFTLTTSF